MTSDKHIFLKHIGIFILLVLSVPLMAQQKHALLIGISDYPQYKDSDASWSCIHGANDVQLLSPILSKQGFKVSCSSFAKNMSIFTNNHAHDWCIIMSMISENDEHDFKTSCA